MQRFIDKRLHFEQHFIAMGILISVVYGGLHSIGCGTGCGTACVYRPWCCRRTHMVGLGGFEQHSQQSVDAFAAAHHLHGSVQVLLRLQRQQHLIGPETQSHVTAALPPPPTCGLMDPRGLCTCDTISLAGSGSRYQICMSEQTN